MDALIVFACIFTPTFLLNLLSAGRDEILFEQRPKASRWLVAVAVVAGLVVLIAVGLPPGTATALVVAGPVGSYLGNLLGSGDRIVVAHRIRQALRRDRRGD